LGWRRKEKQRGKYVFDRSLKIRQYLERNKKKTKNVKIKRKSLREKKT